MASGRWRGHLEWAPVTSTLERMEQTYLWPDEAVLAKLLVKVEDGKERGKIAEALRQSDVKLLAVNVAPEAFLFKLADVGFGQVPRYGLFFLAHLFEVRRKALLSAEYSFREFPRKWVSRRGEIEDVFARLVLSTREGRGWFGEDSWDDLPLEQRALAGPVYLEDNAFS